MTTLVRWFSDVKGVWRAIGLVVAIFVAGWTTAAVANGLTALPAQVAQLEQRADSLETSLTTLALAVEEIRENNRTQLCLQIAEKRRTDWRECLK